MNPYSDTHEDWSAPAQATEETTRGASELIISKWMIGAFGALFVVAGSLAFLVWKTSGNWSNSDPSTTGHFSSPAPTGPHKTRSVPDTDPMMESPSARSLRPKTAPRRTAAPTRQPNRRRQVQQRPNSPFEALRAD